MKLAYEADIPLTPQGGRTGLSGGALPVAGGVLLSLMRMNKDTRDRREEHAGGRRAGRRGGRPAGNAEKHNLFFPPDPSSTIESTLGGNVAENAGYTRAVKYGVTRDYILGLEAVLPNGDIINVGGRTVKNVDRVRPRRPYRGVRRDAGRSDEDHREAAAEAGLRRTCIFYLDDLVAAADLVVGHLRKRHRPVRHRVHGQHEHQLRGRLPLRIGGPPQGRRRYGARRSGRKPPGSGRRGREQGVRAGPEVQRRHRVEARQRRRGGGPPVAHQAGDAARAQGARQRPPGGRRSRAPVQAALSGRLDKRERGRERRST